MIEAIETILTLGFSAIALFAAAGFVLFRQPVYAALCFTVAVLAATGLYVLQGAAYVAAATTVIYAGATIIIFLFVLMFAQHSQLQPYELKFSNLPVAIVASLCLALLLGYAVTTRPVVNAKATLALSAQTADDENASTSATNMTGKTAPESEASETRASATQDSASGMTVADLGRVAYTRYLWTIELAGTLLLVAAGGAIFIAQRHYHSTSSGAAA